MTNEQQEIEVRTDLHAGDDGGLGMGSGNAAPTAPATGTLGTGH